MPRTADSDPPNGLLRDATMAGCERGTSVSGNQSAMAWWAWTRRTSGKDGVPLQYSRLWRPGETRKARTVVASRRPRSREARKTDWMCYVQVPSRQPSHLRTGGRPQARATWGEMRCMPVIRHKQGGKISPIDFSTVPVAGRVVGVVRRPQSQAWSKVPEWIR